jgi:hypothetical protein
VLDVDGKRISTCRGRIVGILDERWLKGFIAREACYESRVFRPKPREIGKH